MKFKGFDGRQYSIQLTPKHFKASKTCSSYHKRVRNILTNLFPTTQIVEEFVLPGSRFASNKNLIADFFVPRLNLVVEVHGKQHYEFTPMFHKNQFEFINSKNRDNKKIEWCNLNNIRIVVLKYSETDDEWTTAIKNR